MLRLAAVVLGVCACSSEEEGRAPCNALPNTGQTLMVATSDEVPPVPMGGDIVDGTYELVAITYYGDAAALPDTEIQTVFEIDGNTMQQVGSIDGEELRYTSTFSTSGTTVTTRDTCPAALTSRFEYTATADRFYIYDERAGAIMEQRFDLQD